MYYGELKEKGDDYINGHFTGSVRAYDDAIHMFEFMAKDKPTEKVKYSDVANMLGLFKEQWLLHCENFGLGLSED